MKQIKIQKIFFFNNIKIVTEKKLLITQNILIVSEFEVGRLEDGEPVSHGPGWLLAGLALVLGVLDEVHLHVLRFSSHRQKCPVGGRFA